MDYDGEVDSALYDKRCVWYKDFEFEGCDLKGVGLQLESRPHRKNHTYPYRRFLARARCLQQYGCVDLPHTEGEGRVLLIQPRVGRDTQSCGRWERLS